MPRLDRKPSSTSLSNMPAVANFTEVDFLRDELGLLFPCLNSPPEEENASDHDTDDEEMPEAMSESIVSIGNVDEGGRSRPSLHEQVAELRYSNLLKRNQELALWRRAWDQHLQQSADAPSSSPAVDKVASEMPTALTSADYSPVDGLPAKTLRLPPAPEPLPPCLQCALAGRRCSLLKMPYAQGFINDLTGEKHDKRKHPYPSMPDTSWEAESARLAEQVSRECPRMATLVAELPRRRRELEQRMLRRAIAQGATDSPFLPLPPMQCAQCARYGEVACLQQSRDLTTPAMMQVVTVTTTAADDSNVRDRNEFAWFATSGPPPRSLLQQHCIPILEQIRLGSSVSAGVGRVTILRHEQVPQPLRQPGARAAIKSSTKVRRRQPILEAVFCRDPSVLTATQVAARAQILLQDIAAKRRTETDHNPQRVGSASALQTRIFEPMRPATTLEIARLLPRRNQANVYAGRSVATAALLKAERPVEPGQQEDKDSSKHSSKHIDSGLVASGSRMLPRWDLDKAGKPQPKYKSSEYFAKLRNDRDSVRRLKERRAGDLSVDGSKGRLQQALLPYHSREKTAEAETPDERHARIMRMAHELTERLRVDSHARLFKDGASDDDELSSQTSLDGVVDDRPGSVLPDGVNDAEYGSDGMGAGVLDEEQAAEQDKSRRAIADELRPFGEEHDLWLRPSVGEDDA